MTNREPWRVSTKNGLDSERPIAATLLKFEDPFGYAIASCVRLIALLFFQISDFFQKPVVLNTCLNSICSYYL